MKTPELKPCPFCGAKAVLHGDSYFNVNCSNEKNCSMVMINKICTSYSKEEAIKSWNRRPEQSQLDEEAVRMCLGREYMNQGMDVWITHTALEYFTQAIVRQFSQSKPSRQLSVEAVEKVLLTTPYRIELQNQIRNYAEAICSQFEISAIKWPEKQYCASHPTNANWNYPKGDHKEFKYCEFCFTFHIHNNTIDLCIKAYSLAHGKPSRLTRDKIKEIIKHHAKLNLVTGIAYLDVDDDLEACVDELADQLEGA